MKASLKRRHIAGLNPPQQISVKQSSVKRSHALESGPHSRRESSCHLIVFEDSVAQIHSDRHCIRESMDRGQVDDVRPVKLGAALIKEPPDVFNPDCAGSVQVPNKVNE